MESENQVDVEKTCKGCIWLDNQPGKNEVACSKLPADKSGETITEDSEACRWFLLSTEPLVTTAAHLLAFDAETLNAIKKFLPLFIKSSLQEPEPPPVQPVAVSVGDLVQFKIDDKGEMKTVKGRVIGVTPGFCKIMDLDEESDGELLSCSRKHPSLVVLKKAKKSE